MAFAKWQRTIVNESGDVQGSADVEVRVQSSNALASIYQDAAGTTPKANPFTTGSDGKAEFFAPGNVYNIAAEKGAYSETWEYVSIGSAQGLDIETVQEIIDEAVAAGVNAEQVDFISGIIPLALNQDYRLVVNLPFGIEITETTTRCTGGTATATFKINSTALGGTVNSVSTSEQSRAHASNNVAAAGDDIVLTISSASSCVNFSFTITFNRTLETG